MSEMPRDESSVVFVVMFHRSTDDGQDSQLQGVFTTRELAEQAVAALKYDEEQDGHKVTTDWYDFIDEGYDVLLQIELQTLDRQPAVEHEAPK